MAQTLMKKLKKQLKRWQKTVPPVMSWLLVLSIGVLVYAGYMSTRRVTVDATAFAPLLNLIAQAESSNNYNAHFGNTQNSAVDFTTMSVTEVMAWQEEFVHQGSPSSAVGRYQIIKPTLAGLVSELDVDPAQKFDEALQDKLAVALLERRGASAYVNNEITREQFAANLAKEWAALPKVIGDNPHDSYYASDGINKSRVEIPAILAVIDRASAYHTR